MSNLIEKIKKRIEARKWKITDDASVPELIGMQYANNMNDWCLKIIDEELAKEPQECNSDLISRNKLIDDIETLRNQIHILTTNIRSLVPTKCDNVSAINEKCNNIMSEIDAFQTGYKQQHKYNSDLISRNMLIESFNASINTGYETFPFDIIVEVINNQPQVQQWIPCSERLPTKEEHCKNDGRFIVSNGIKSYECTFDVYEEIFKQFGYNRKGIWMEYIDDKIIAWQPLPSVWKGENNAEK